MQDSQEKTPKKLSTNKWISIMAILEEVQPANSKTKVSSSWKKGKTLLKIKVATQKPIFITAGQTGPKIRLLSWPITI